MNILCDFHHSDLWWSNHLIFERALGHTLFRPRGMEWFERGYWHLDAQHVARQFLVDSMFKLSEIHHYPQCRVKVPTEYNAGLRASMGAIEGCQYFPFINTLSFDEFADAKIDVIMATQAGLQEPFLRLKKDLKPNAKLVREEGNILGWTALHPEFPNLLTSDLPTFQRANAHNKFLYHQRFDTENILTFTEPTVFNRITSFMPMFRAHKNLYEFADSHDSGMELVDYGHHSKGGFLVPKARYAEAMRATSFVWHVKPGGDGFGHVIHNSFAMGRPVITIEEDYRNAIAHALLEDGKTCILIGRDPVENSKKIRSMSDPATITEMCRNAAAKFRNYIDYKFEADQIRVFLERLL